VTPIVTTLYVIAAAAALVMAWTIVAVVTVVRFIFGEE